MRARAASAKQIHQPSPLLFVVLLLRFCVIIIYCALN
jgi:hypothetical protein